MLQRSGPPEKSGNRLFWKITALSPSITRGTEGSNPPSSSGEFSANLKTTSTSRFRHSISHTRRSMLAVPSCILASRILRQPPVPSAAGYLVRGLGVRTDDGDCPHGYTAGAHGHRLERLAPNRQVRRRYRGRKDCAGEGARHFRRDQGQFGCGVRMGAAGDLGTERRKGRRKTANASKPPGSTPPKSTGPKRRPRKHTADAGSGPATPQGAWAGRGG